MRRAAAAALAALLCACAREAPRAASQTATQQMKGVHMVETQSGRRVWEIQSSSATIEEDTEIVDMERPDLSIEKKGEGATHIKAAVGRFDSKSRDMVFKGDVVAYSEKEDSTLYTQTLTYASANDRIWTHDAVRIENQDGTVNGRDLSAKSDMSEMKLKKNEGVLK